MEDFIFKFLICNIIISIIIGILFITRHLLKKILTNRMKYNLCFLLFVLLAIPFIPVRLTNSFQFFSWFSDFKNISYSNMEPMIQKTTAFNFPKSQNWMNDFGIEVSNRLPSLVGLILCSLWIIGIIVMTVLLLKSAIKFNALKKSSLPLQNQAVNELYLSCLKEMNITKNIPIYSTAFLKSPATSGLFKPCIHLPIHIISNYNTNEIRYILLHELQHYKHKDILVNYIINIFSVLYWFNPFVWYAIRNIKNDREVACDTSVLTMLEENEYKNYGNTLINFVEKVSHLSSPFATSISGSMAQMQKRILNIANYYPTSFKYKLYSSFVYILISIFLLGFIPILSTQTNNNDYYSFDEYNKDITYINLDNSFGKNKGSFVLYDSTEDTWKIYNKDYALTRVSPVSTYKIYSALFGLESNIISPEQSLISWDGKDYELDVWNSDQTLESAMQNSVTWYFQAIDKQSDLSTTRDYIKKIGYGNQIVGDDLSSYWVDSSLKISPIEQIEMLQKFYYNQFDFSSKNIDTVKDSIRLYSTNNGTVYGKTGTGEINGRNSLGWFIGYIEKNDHIYFFATDIQNEELATGAIATDLTFSILSDLKIWN